MHTTIEAMLRSFVACHLKYHIMPAVFSLVACDVDSTAAAMAPDAICRQGGSVFFTPHLHFAKQQKLFVCRRVTPRKDTFQARGFVHQLFDGFCRSNQASSGAAAYFFAFLAKALLEIFDEERHAQRITANALLELAAALLATAGQLKCSYATVLALGPFFDKAAQLFCTDADSNDDNGTPSSCYSESDAH